MSNSLVQNNDELIQIYKRRVDLVFRICFTYMKNEQDAEDAVQEVFLKYMRKPQQFNNLDHEKAWFIVTASNHCKNILKHWWRKNKDLNDYEETIPAKAIEVDEMLDLIINLPEKYKTVVYMYYYEGYSSVEIATILKKPQSTIRNYLHLARKLLKNELV